MHNIPHTKETKEKISKAKIGTKPSMEARAKMSLAKIGNKCGIGNHNALGKHWKVKDTSKWKNRRGNLSANWKGGVTKERDILKHTEKYKEWRIKVFYRDNFTCQTCKNIGGILHAHHINSWAKFPKLRFDVNNGITLCKECHKLTDNYGSKKVRISLDIRTISN